MCVKPSNCRVGRAERSGAKPTERSETHRASRRPAKLNPPNGASRRPAKLNPPRLGNGGFPLRSYPPYIKKKFGNGGFSFAGLRLRYAPTHPTSKKNVFNLIGKRYNLINRRK